MKATPSTTVLEAVEARIGSKLEAESNRRILGDMTLHEWATYLSEDAPRPVPQERLPTEHRRALELVDIVARRLRSKGRGLVERHGPADPPEWAEKHHEQREENTVTDEGPISDEIIREAARTLWDVPSDLDEVGGSDRRSPTTQSQARGPRQPERTQDGEPVSDEALRRAAQDLFN